MILIVDDKPENLIALQKTLEPRGFEIDTAGSGEEALKKVLKQTYDLIILDVQMPGMDGFEVAEAVGGYSKTSNIPIIFLSAVNVSKEFIEKGYASGGKDYLVKPFDIDILVLKIKTFVKLHEQNVALHHFQHTLLEEIEQRKHAESKKDEFISIASHELNTPLTSVKGYLQLAEKTLKQGKYDRSEMFISQSKKQVEKLNRLVGDLLDSTKIASGGLTFAFKDFDFDQFVDNTVDSIRQSYPTKQISCSGRSQRLVNGDESRLEQVLSNYLTNAIKYAPDSDQVYVEVAALPDGQVEVRVRDLGVGISEEKQQHIFDKFYRVEENAIRFQGLGMGLFICAEILRKHWGTYGVQSEVGKGSTFYFRLPSDAAY